MRRGRRKVVVPFLLPAFAIYTWFFAYPSVQAIWVSLHQWTGFGAEMSFVGLKNYIGLFNDKIFWMSVRNTALIAFGGGAFIFLFGMYFTTLYQRKLHGMLSFRTFIFFPMLIPGIGLGIIWKFIYNTKIGPLSATLDLLGLGALEPVWLGPSWVMTSITIAVVWIFTGYYMTLLMAGVDKIPNSFFDAAIIDGASQLKMFFRITLPMTWDVFLTAVLLWYIAAIRMFDLIVALNFPTPAVASFTMSVYVWVNAFGTFYPINKLGYATSIGVAMLIIVLIGYGIIRIFRRETIEY